MHPAIPHLIELQRVDHQIAVLRAELEAFPKRIREAETKLSGARADVASAKEAHTHIVTERKKYELDVQQWKDRAALIAVFPRAVFPLLHVKFVFLSFRDD